MSESMSYGFNSKGIGDRWKGQCIRMATFTDFEVWYHGKAPLGIMSIVRNEMTVSGLLTVGIVEGDSIHI